MKDTKTLQKQMEDLQEKMSNVMIMNEAFAKRLEAEEKSRKALEEENSKLRNELDVRSDAQSFDAVKEMQHIKHERDEEANAKRSQIREHLASLYSVLPACW